LYIHPTQSSLTSIVWTVPLIGTWTSQSPGLLQEKFAPQAPTTVYIHCIVHRLRCNLKGEVARAREDYLVDIPDSDSRGAVVFRAETVQTEANYMFECTMRGSHQHRHRKAPPLPSKCSYTTLSSRCLLKRQRIINWVRGGGVLISMHGRLCHRRPSWMGLLNFVTAGGPWVAW
jgi:hypothetical protein